MSKEQTIRESEELLNEIASIVASYLPGTETREHIIGVGNSLVSDDPSSFPQAILGMCDYSYDVLDAYNTVGYSGINYSGVNRYRIEEELLTPLRDIAEEMFDCSISDAQNIARGWTESISQSDWENMS